MCAGILKFAGVSGLLLGMVPACAQTAPDATLGAALTSLGARAGVVFAGEVTAVRKLTSVVEVEFRVDQVVKGQSTGSYVLREWSGLWAAGQRRYWVGERAVVFLHPPGRGGLSSPVDGMEGILPITPTSSAAQAVDIDRLRTRVLRPVGAPMSEAGARMSLAEVATAVLGEAAPVVPPVPRPRPLPRPVRPLPVRPLPVEALPEQPRAELQEVPERLPRRQAVEIVDGIR